MFASILKIAIDTRQLDLAKAFDILYVCFLIRKAFLHEHTRADIREHRSCSLSGFPAFQRQDFENIRAAFWKMKPSAVLHIGHDLFVCFPLVGKLCPSGNLPQHYPIAPNIRLTCENIVSDRLWSHPTNWQ